MSLQKAIDIYYHDGKFNDSPDTQHKKNLTAWIEKKKWFECYERNKDKDVLYKDENPYSIFEAWQKDPNFLYRKLQEKFKDRYLDKKVIITTAGSELRSNVCPRTTEETVG